MNTTRFRGATVLLAFVAIGCDESSGPVGDADAWDIVDAAEVDVEAEVEAEAEAGGDTEADGDEWTTGHSTPASITAWFSSTPSLGPVTGVFCRCEPPLAPGSELILEDGPCVLTRRLPPQDWTACVPLDVGDVVVEIATTAYPLTLVSDYPEMPCMFTAGPDVPEPPPGTPVRFASTGGADLPAFDVTLTMPPVVTLTAPAEHSTLVVGGSWVVSWDPAAPNPVRIIVGGRDLSVLCDTNEAPPLAIAAELTGLWSELDVPGYVQLQAHVEDEVPGDIPVYLGLDRFGGYVGVAFAAAP